MDNLSLLSNNQRIQISIHGEGVEAQRIFWNYVPMEIEGVGIQSSGEEQEY